MRPAAVLLAAVPLLLAPLLAASSAAAEWHAVPGPSPGPPQVIGGPAAGCLAGAVPLPPEGVGYQAIRLSRQRNYGHPELVDFVQDLGRAVAAAGLGTMLVADMQQPRGGPMQFGHVSHQSGVDADVWFELGLPPMPRARREDLRYASTLAPGGRRVDPARFGPAQAELVRLAASDPRTDRVLVNPAIKLALCEMRWPDRSWLQRVRPWRGHDGHMHVRLDCPAGSPACTPPRPIPAGDGCGEELMSWFREAPREERPRAPQTAPPRPALPSACAAVLRAPAG
jgi:penicillin-insensitive murein endopeptidase